MIFRKLFEPVSINRLVVKNRIVMPAMALFYTDDYGFNDRYKAFYEERARGGVGLMIIGPVAIDKVGASPFIPGLFADGQIKPLSEFVAELHSGSDVRIGVQLMHQGRIASAKLTGETPMAPSPVESPLTGEKPREMTTGDIETVQEAYVAASLRAREAGIDYIEILMAGGYLVGQFLSPVSNFRTDAYGGSPENRMRFGLETIERVRGALGPEAAMGIRVSGHDFLKSGNTINESSRFCTEAQKAGIDAVNVTGGWHESSIPQVTGDVPAGAFLYLSRAVKRRVSVPVFASNRLGDPVVAENALLDGFADMICWGRPLIADPELSKKTASGRLQETVPCIGCNQGCMDSIFSGKSVCCTVNPRVGRERKTKLSPTRAKNRIFVAGGGPAGMQFALIADQRGHEVTLFEKEARLGGQVNLIGSIPGRRIFLEMVRSFSGRLSASSVKVKLSTMLTKEKVLEARPDILVVATGAKPAALAAPGVERPNVLHSWDVLSGAENNIGRRVAVIGGGATGCETAWMVAKRGLPNAETFYFLSYYDVEDLKRLLLDCGREITIIETADKMAATMGVTTRWVLMKNLRQIGVSFRTHARVVEIGEEGVHIDTPNGKESIAADTVILALGAIPRNELAGKIPVGKTETFTIGDAKKIGNIPDAVGSGFDLALTV